MQLRDYQIECIEAIKSNYSECKRQLISLPTGSGKTIVFCSVSEQLQKKTLIITNMIDLVSQIQETIASFFPSRKFLLIEGEKKIDPSAEIFLSTIQTAHRRIEILKNLGIELIIIDEAHHACASTYKKLISECFKDLLIGFTATPINKNIEVFDKIVYHKSIFDLIKKNYLCPLIAKRIFTKISLIPQKQHCDKQILTDFYDVGERKESDDFSKDQLEYISNVHERNELIIKTYKEFAIDRKRTLCFCASREHGKNMARMFNEEGISSDYVDGDVKPHLRKEIYERFLRGEIKVLTNCKLLTEGSDLKPVDCILMARPTRSNLLYTQMLGRGTRLHEEKKDCLVIDFNDQDCEIITLEQLQKEAKKENKEEIEEEEIKEEWEENQKKGEIEEESDKEYQYRDNALYHSTGEIIKEDFNLEDNSSGNHSSKNSNSSKKNKEKDEEDDSSYNPYGKNRHHFLPITQKQADTLLNFKEKGMLFISDEEIDLLDRSRASKLISSLISSDDRPTDKQIKVLTRYGYDPEEINRTDARKIIGELASNNWKPLLLK